MPELRMMPVLHDPGHRNPPLAELNRAAREAEAERRDDGSEIARAAHDAIEAAVFGKPGETRRIRKPLRGLAPR